MTELLYRMLARHLFNRFIPHGWFPREKIPSVFLKYPAPAPRATTRVSVGDFLLPVGFDARFLETLPRRALSLANTTLRAHYPTCPTLGRSA